MPLQNSFVTPDEPTDENQLWKSFLDGELMAWKQIFSLFYKDLYGYGLKLSASPELTKDCIHELFVVLWERKNHLDEEVDSVKAYLLTSLRRKLLKKLQRKRKYYARPDSKKNLPKGIQFSPEEVIIAAEEKTRKREVLYHALESLPERQKEVLYLKYFNGMSYDEIEEILSINYQSIRNHIYRAIKKLRKILDQDISGIVISLLTFLLSSLFWI